MAAVLVVVAAAVGLKHMAESNLPGRPGPLDSNVRIAVALNGDKGVPGALRHAAGNAPLINAFNENQNYCGSSANSDHHYITSGSYQDIIIQQHKVGPGEQATSLQIIPTTNELCIAYISQTWADGTHRGWLGDMGRGCDRDWYYSNVIVGDSHKPACTWVDSDHNYGITTGALQIHMQDFTNLTADYNTDPQFYCTWPTMLFQADAIGYHSTGTKVHKPKKIAFWDASLPSAGTDDIKNDGVDETRKTRRSTRLGKRSGLAVFPHLIASPHDKHSARELCENERSHGPDFFSLSEKIFCDMDTKTQWPLCNGTAAAREGCYHWDTHSLVLAGERRPRGYSRVEEWE